MHFSFLLFVSKKNLKAKCSQCNRLLPLIHFGSQKSAPLHTVTCMSCKPLCVVCGIRKPLDQFSKNVGALTSSAQPSSSDFTRRDLVGASRSLSVNSTAAVRALVAEEQLSERKIRERVCDGCFTKEHLAQTNVYFRFPILKYKSCPFSADDYRAKMDSDDPD